MGAPLAPGATVPNRPERPQVVAALHVALLLRSSARHLDVLRLAVAGPQTSQGYQDSGLGIFSMVFFVHGHPWCRQSADETRGSRCLASRCAPQCLSSGVPGENPPSSRVCGASSGGEEPRQKASEQSRCARKEPGAPPQECAQIIKRIIMCLLPLAAAKALARVLARGAMLLQFNAGAAWLPRDFEPLSACPDVRRSCPAWRFGLSRFSDGCLEG